MKNRADELVVDAIKKHLVTLLEQRPYRRLLLTTDAIERGRVDSPRCEIKFSGPVSAATQAEGDQAQDSQAQDGQAGARYHCFHIRVHLEAPLDFQQNVFYSLLELTDCLHQAEVEIDEGAIIDVSFMEAAFHKSSAEDIAQATAQFSVAFLED